jgi:AcrR family transcriptional regulator
MPVPEPGPSSAPTARKPAHQLGRKRDDSRDHEILRATLDVLAESGYEGMTIDMVATRAKAGKATVYRRWATKGDLVLAALASAIERGHEQGGLPDTGTLRGDLLAMATPHWLGASHRRLQIMAALASLLSHTPELAEATHKALVEPSAAVYQQLLQRAADRGEIDDTADLTILALIIPSMSSYQVMFAKESVDRAFVEAIIDGILLPAVGHRPGKEQTTRP